jgi:hypothetical protein
VRPQPGNEWLTVSNAARFLGVSKQAVRQRIYRDTIPHRKDHDGTIYVRITAHNPEANGETNGENTAITGGVDRELVDELRDRVGFLDRKIAPGFGPCEQHYEPYLVRRCV